MTGESLPIGQTCERMGLPVEPGGSGELARLEARRGKRCRRAGGEFLDSGRPGEFARPRVKPASVARGDFSKRNPRRDALGRPEVQRLVRLKALELVGRLGLKAQDRGDLEQELFRRLAHRLPKFDPARSPLTCYARLALDSDAANILRERRARKRYGGHVRSLDYDLGRGDFDVSLDRRTNRSASDDLRHAELALDVAELLARLSPEDREAVRAVAEFSKTRAAARLGVTRARLDARLEALRRRLVRFSREFG